MVAQRHLERLGFDGRARDLGVPPDETILDAVRDIDDLAVLQHDAVLDLGVLDQHVMVDRRKGSHVRVDQSRILSNNGRPADAAVDDLGALPDGHFAIHLGITIDIAFDAVIDSISFFEPGEQQD